MSVDAPGPSSASPGPTSRRRALALLGAGSAAGLATLFSRDEARAGHDGSNVLHLGSFNQSPGSTHLANSGAGETLHLTKDQGGGEALFMEGKGNIESCAKGPAFNVVNCEPEGGIGISVFAGFEDPDPDSTLPALGFALVVNGRSAFSTVGSAVIPAGSESAFVPNLAVGEKSHITVTLVSDPGPRQLSWVERSPGSGFTVHLTSAPRRRRPETALTYMIVEPLDVVPPDAF